MEFIKKYTPKHYKHYLKKADAHIFKYKDINTWAKRLDKEDLTMWVRTIMLFEKNDADYYEEFSIMLTLIIRFFIYELEVESEEIGLNNKQIKNLFNKFKVILYIEYSNRFDMDTKQEDVVHSLL